MILVVGGSRGLGYAIANQYSKKYKVIVLSRFQNLKKKNISFKKCNINNEKDLNKIIKGIKKKSLTSIYCVAGIINEKDDIYLNSSIKQTIFNTNFISISNICQKLITQNKIKNNGLICFCSSVSTLFPRSKQIYYTASKMALNSFYNSLLSTTKKNNLNIRVANLILGFLDTKMNSDKKTFFKKSNVNEIAIKLFKKDKNLNGEYYIPNYWRIIKLIFDILPKKLIFYLINKLNL